MKINSFRMSGVLVASCLFLTIGCGKEEKPTSSVSIPTPSVTLPVPKVTLNDDGKNWKNGSTDPAFPNGMPPTVHGIQTPGFLSVGPILGNPGGSGFSGVLPR